MTTPQMRPVQLLKTLGITGDDPAQTTSVEAFLAKFNLTGGRPEEGDGRWEMPVV